MDCSQHFIMGLCASSNKAVVEDVVVTAEKQPWAVVQKTLVTGDLLFLSGFEWIPQLTGRRKFFSEEPIRWTYVGFVVVKDNVPYVFELESNDTKLRNMNGEFRSGAVNLSLAEHRIFKKVGGETSDINYYTRGCVRHLQNLKLSKKDRIAIRKGLAALQGRVFKRDNRALFQAHLAQGEYNAKVVDESEYFSAELVLLILEIYELVLKGGYNPFQIEVEDFENIQNLERNAFYSAPIPINLEYGVGIKWEELLINYEPMAPMDIYKEKKLNEEEPFDIKETKGGDALLAMSESAAEDAIKLDKENKYDEAAKLYKKAIDCLSHYIMLDAYFRETENGPFYTPSTM